MLPKHLVSLSILPRIQRVATLEQRYAEAANYVLLLLSLSYENVKDQICISPVPRLLPLFFLFLSFSPISNQTSLTQFFAPIRQTLTYRSSNVIFACTLFLSFFSPLPSLVHFYRSTEYGRITERARIYNNLITFPPCRYRDNNYALMARGWNDIMHPLKARKRHCFDASVSHQRLISKSVPAIHPIHRTDFDNITILVPTFRNRKRIPRCFRARI